MTAEECVAEIRDNIQATLNDVPIYDGFPDGSRPAGRMLTSILRVLNVAYSKCCQYGFLSCYQNLTLVVGNKEFEMDGSYGMIYEVQLIDLNGRIYVLPEMSKQELNVLRPYHNSFNNGRPLRYYTIGNIFGFDRAPDNAYSLKILADIEPDQLVNRGDVPARLPLVSHHKLCSVASYALGLQLIRLQTNQGADQSGYARLSGLKAEAQDATDYLKGLATARSLSTNRVPLVDDPYRRQ